MTTAAPQNAATPEQLAAAAEAEARLQMLMSLGDVNQANAATGLYGDSGTGKTSLAATAAEYCWTRFHRTTRYISKDLGGFGNKMLRLIRLNIVEVYNPSNHVEPFETMEDLSNGYWPEKINDLYTGYAEPDVRLVAPQVTAWSVYCPQGHVVRTLQNKASLQAFSIQCPTCKTLTTTQNWQRVEEVTIRNAKHAHVGLWIYDSGTSLQDWALQDMAGRAAKNMDISAGPGDNALNKTGGRVSSGRLSFGTNAPAHYGFAQNRMPGWIANARTIPGIVVPPIFTFLELRATDDTGKGAMPIYGPKIAGSAKTSDVPSWLGNCLHVSREQNEKNQMVHRLWLVNHIDQGGVAPHLAKTRAEPGSLPAYLEDKEGEPAFTRFSLAYFFNELERVLYAGADQDVVDFPDAPLFKPFAEEADQVISRKDLSGSEVTRPTTGARTLVTGAPTARPAVAAVVAGSAAQARPAVAPAAVPRPAAVVAATVAPAQPAQATAPAQVAQPKPTMPSGTATAAKPATAAPATPAVASAQAAAPKPAVAAPAAQAPAKPATAAPAAVVPAKPAVAAVVQAPKPAVAAATAAPVRAATLPANPVGPTPVKAATVVQPTTTAPAPAQQQGPPQPVPAPAAPAATMQPAATTRPPVRPPVVGASPRKATAPPPPGQQPK